MTGTTCSYQSLDFDMAKSLTKKKGGLSWSKLKITIKLMNK